ncbi:MAG TPA: hypothetical protein PLO24_10565, partial [Bacteroidales bacterium]|nr:hypothetical protein [Bacteroidales bacterium]
MRRFTALYILLVLFAFQDSAAQKRRHERAYDAYNAGEYYDAIDEFKNTYSKTKKSDKESRAEYIFMIAECYRRVNDPRNAETWYKQAVRSAFSRPEAQF